MWVETEIFLWGEEINGDKQTAIKPSARELSLVLKQEIRTRYSKKPL